MRNGLDDATNVGRSVIVQAKRRAARRHVGQCTIAIKQKVPEFPLWRSVQCEKLSRSHEDCGAAESAASQV